MRSAFDLLQSADLPSAIDAFADSWFVTCFCRQLICDLLLQSSDLRPAFDTFAISWCATYFSESWLATFWCFCNQLFATCFWYVCNQLICDLLYILFAISWIATCFWYFCSQLICDLLLILLQTTDLRPAYDTFAVSLSTLVAISVFRFLIILLTSLLSKFFKIRKFNVFSFTFFLLFWQYSDVSVVENKN